MTINNKLFGWGMSVAATAPLFAEPQLRQDEPPPPAATAAPAANTVLRLARSDDGRTFIDTGEVFCQQASAPDLVCLPDGNLLALFDVAVDPTGSDEIAMAVSRSPDEGRSWSPPRRVRLVDVHGKQIPGRHGDLLRVRRNLLGLYFASPTAGKRASEDDRRGGAVTVRYAVSRDGINFRVDPHDQISLRSAADLHPMILPLGKRIHLLASDFAFPDTGQRTTGHARARHLVSSDGRRFARVSPVHLPDTRFLGCVTALPDGARAYLSSEAGICSAVSPDGRTWKLEDGVRLDRGWDPAVIRLKDESYLMIYCADADEATRTASPLVKSPSDFGPHGKSVTAADADPVFGQSPETSHRVASTDAANVAWPDETAPPEENAWPEDDAGAAEAGIGPDVEDLEDLWLADDEGFAPQPNFKAKTDYIAWYKQQMLPPADDNAADAYAAFMPIGRKGSPDEADWPVFDDMLNGPDSDGPPKPWDPQSHPQWEASKEATQHGAALRKRGIRHAGQPPPGRPASALAELPPHHGQSDHRRRLAHRGRQDSARTDAGSVGNRAPRCRPPAQRGNTDRAPCGTGRRSALPPSRAVGVAGRHL